MCAMNMILVRVFSAPCWWGYNVSGSLYTMNDRPFGAALTE
jgi:hypothetical protein